MAIEVHGGGSAVPAPYVGMQEWQIMREQAGVLVKTGFLPASIKTPEQALAIMLKGRELGIPPMQALSAINVIQGKPTASAELMLSLIYRDHGNCAIQFARSDDTACTISYARRGWPSTKQFSFTLDDAKRAGLTGGNWQKYPGAMLRARCISAVARMAFPDSIGGMYTPEELGATVRVQDGGDIVVEALPVDTDTGEVLPAQPQPNELVERIREKASEAVAAKPSEEERKRLLTALREQATIIRSRSAFAEKAGATYEELQSATATELQAALDKLELGKSATITTTEETPATEEAGDTADPFSGSEGDDDAPSLRDHPMPEGVEARRALLGELLDELGVEDGPDRVRWLKERDLPAKPVRMIADEGKLARAITTAQAALRGDAPEVDG